VTTPAGGLIGDATINVNANTAAAAAALRGLTRDANGQLRDLRGRFVSESRLINSAFTRAAGGGSAFAGVLQKLRAAAIPLSPALIPIAAQAAPIAASVGAAAIAVAAFGAAAAGQVTAITEATEAEQKYQDAIDEHGKTSQEAAEAQNAYVRQVQQMPAATRTTAAALSSLKTQYQDWSDSLADSTMPVATKALETFSSVFPKLTPMVQGAGVQLDRFVTIAAGGIASPGFDRFMQSFSDFAVGALTKANDALVRFTRTLDTGQVSGGVSQFMEYARANAPLVQDTLAKLAQALGNVLQAAANVGPGLLTVVNALAGLVAAVPPGVITAMLQLALAMKVVRLAAVAMAATSAGMAGFAASIGAMRLAAAGATGVLPRLAAAIATLSRTAKVALAGTGVGLLVIALSELSQIGDEAPPDVDKLTKSLEKLGHTGKATGYVAQEFGANFGKLRSQIDRVTDPSVVESINNWGSDITGGFLDAGDDTEKFTKSIGSIDSALADLVSGGKASQAAAAINVMTKGMNAEQLAKFNGGLGDYKDALADLKFEQQVTAQAMGLFGQQAQQTSAKLAEQKASADGLRAAIQALNDVNRAGLSGMIGFEAAIDAATKSAQENAGVLSFQNGQLSLNTDKQREAAGALNDLAAKTDAAAGAARENGQSWSSVNGIYQRGREELVKSAVQMGLTRDQAKALAAQILQTPNKTALLKADITDWKSKISEAEKQLKTAKGDKKAKLTADIADWKAKVAQAELQLKGVKADKRAKLTADIADWRAKIAEAERQLRTAKGEKRAKLTANITDWQRKIAAAQGQINSLPASRSTRLTITTVREYISKYNTIGRPAQGEGGVSKYAAGGTPKAGEMAMVGEQGPELVVFGQAARVFDAATTQAMMSGTVGAGRDAARGLAAGMQSTAGVSAAARAMAAAAVTAVRAELEISSPSKKLAAIGKDTGAGFIKGLTGTREQIQSTVTSMAKAITNAFRGVRTRVDDQLVAMLGRNNTRLKELASERDRIGAQLEAAMKFRTDTATASRSFASLGNLGIEGKVTAKGVTAGLRERLRQLRAFAGNLRRLTDLGVRKDVLRQIIEMGPDDGSAYAAALVAAGKQGVKQINSVQAQIARVSNAIGTIGADALYDSGRNAGKGFLTGLKEQKKSIEQLMLDIAKGMQKAIRRALGIRSPSRVMAALGRMSILGLEGGIVRSVPGVDAAMQRVAGAVTSGVPTTLPDVGTVRTRQSGVTAPPAQVTVNLNLTNQGVIGSKFEMQNWLAGALDDLGRTGRLPAAVGGR
jgi:trimeric autotransporter adhesin